jgi:E3 ubiquitin-protein ligase RNF38/44
MASSFFNFNFTITNLILILLLLHQHSITVFVVAFTENNNNNTETSPPPTPIPEDATTIPQRTFTPFKPSVAIVISVFTVLFSVTFLLLLYIKHINNTTNAETINIESSSYGGGGGISSFSAGRKNSGVDRSVVESLPIFKFGSLTGQKEGLDCAVCLSKFESSEVLRLLPKCKHAFHVECVDTWLDAHSTCPLCRYRVDPEDILLVMENSSSSTLASSVSRDSRQIQNQKEENDECVVEIERGTMTRNEIAEYYRKRHSSVGEKEWERERERRKTASFRFSLDSSRKKNDTSSVGIGVGLGCFVGPGPRKDGMLLTKEEITERNSVDRRRRLEHRIIVSPSVPVTNIRSGLHKNQRWSDVQPCDLLYLTSEMMIMSESRRVMKKNMNKRNSNDSCWNGRGEINSRSVSEITGFNRFQTNNTTKQ